MMPRATPEPGASALDTPEARDLIAHSLDHPSVYMGGPSRQSKVKAERLIRDLAPHVAAAQAAAWRAGVEAAAAVCDREAEAAQNLAVAYVNDEPMVAEGYYGRKEAAAECARLMRELLPPAALAAPGADAAEALRPFAEIGQWLFARDLPDDTPVFEAGGVNGYGVTLTRGHFKAAHRAFQALTETAPEAAP